MEKTTNVTEISKWAKKKTIEDVHKISSVKYEVNLQKEFKFFCILRLFNLYAPCILYIGQTYRYSPDRYHESSI